MSLAKFSDVVKARIAYTENIALQGEISAWASSMKASYSESIGLTGNDKNVFKNAASLLVQDAIGESGFSVSKFRYKGGTKRNNIFVVTESNLVSHFTFYGLPTPTIKGNKVTPGTSSYYIDPETGEILLDKPVGLIAAYLVWINVAHATKRLEYFTNDSMTTNTSKARTLSKTNSITAIREYNIKHTSTSKRMYNFLVHCGLNDKEIPFSKYTEDWQIGHIEAQSHGRLAITKNARGSYKYDNGLIDDIISLHKYLDLASSSLQPEYTKLEAAVLKSFTGGELYMNVEMQPTGTKNKYNALTNQGSGELSRALGFIATLKAMVLEAPKETDSIPEIRTIKLEIANISKSLTALYSGYIKNKAAIAQALQNFKGMPPDFLLNLESSDSMKTHITKLIAATLITGNSKVTSTKLSHNKVPIVNINTSSSDSLTKSIKQSSDKLKAALNSLKTIKNKTTASSKPKVGSAANITGTPSASAQLRTTSGQFYSLTSLQSLLNTHLQDVIAANMGDEPWDGGQRRILNYRTGRFAASASVERMSQSKEGAITAFYTYMKYPYQTFEPGFVQGTPASRDPKLLIAKSIREIAATKVANRMRSVLV